MRASRPGWPGTQGPRRRTGIGTLAPVDYETRTGSIPQLLADRRSRRPTIIKVDWRDRARKSATALKVDFRSMYQLVAASVKPVSDWSTWRSSYQVRVMRCQAYERWFDLVSIIASALFLGILTPESPETGPLEAGDVVSLVSGDSQ